MTVWSGNLPDKKLEVLDKESEKNGSEMIC
jgi:hypothetical protein